jgi:ATP-dependent DNA helicase DinG
LNDAADRDLDWLFSADGPLAAAIEGYRTRPQQVAMARAIAQAIAANSVLVAEAGTGTGKTFAYLVPALLSGGKVIVSTGTKTLQDQLFDRDIPVVREALRVPVTVALLKGRANYLCHYHLERAGVEGRFASREDAAYLPVLRRFAVTSRDGDKATLPDVPESAGVWTQVTSTRDNCLGSECPHQSKCFVLQARRKALEADVVVVNHHLFFADVMLRDEGVSELLPSCNTVIMDEAHQIPETASLFFGESVSTAQIVELARDARVEAAAAARDFKALPEAAAALEKAARDLRLAVDAEVGRMPATALGRHRQFRPALAAVDARLDTAAGLLETQAGRSEGLERVWVRTRELRDRLARWREERDREFVRWVEVFGSALALNATPLSIAAMMARQVTGQPRSWVFTSATLSVNGDFRHYTAAMGLEDARAESWPSPFDYEKQGLLCVPEGMPPPNTPAHVAAVVDAALPVIRAAGGRAFCVFTSLRAMREAHALLEARFEAEGLGFPLLVQGEGSRTDLLDRFRDLGNAVLVGSASFWEGVDVRGEALSVVVIDKLPFAPPDDPVVAARIERMNEAGQNAFMDYQLPEAAIMLKQGAGRLIRDEQDRGVLMICDARLVEKPYGRRIWRSLPPMRRTRLVADAVAFFANGPAVPP